jgi:hypothetical protein
VLKTPENIAKEAFKRHTIPIQTLKLFSNVRGKLWAGQPMTLRDGMITLKFPRRLDVGLHDGMPDQIGWRQIEITPDMVGTVIAQFTAVELKRFDGKGKITAEQIDMINLINNQGGYAKLVDSEESMREYF